MSQPDIFEKISQMNLDELHDYHTSAKIITCIIDILGVICCFLALIFYSIPLVFISAFALYLLGSSSTYMDKIINFIEDKIFDLE